MERADAANAARSGGDERVIFSRRIFPQRFIIHLMRAVAAVDERLDES